MNLIDTYNPHPDYTLEETMAYDFGYKEAHLPLTEDETLMRRAFVNILCGDVDNFEEEFRRLEITAGGRTRLQRLWIAYFHGLEHGFGGFN